MLHALRVDLRITAETEGTTRIVRVDGRLAREGVGELEGVLRDTTGPLRLELSGLRSADVAGLKALRSLREAGAELSGMSPFIALRLETIDPGAPKKDRSVRRA